MLSSSTILQPFYSRCAFINATSVSRTLLLYKFFFLSFFLSLDPFLLTHCRYRVLWLQLITLNDTHTHTHCRTALEEGSNRCRCLYLTTHNTQNRQILRPPAGFDPAIPASERLQTLATDRTVIGIGIFLIFKIAQVWNCVTWHCIGRSVYPHKKGYYVTCCSKFWIRFHGVSVPSKLTMLELVNKLWTTDW